MEKSIVKQRTKQLKKENNFVKRKKVAIDFDVNANTDNFLNSVTNKKHTLFHF